MIKVHRLAAAVLATLALTATAAAGAATSMEDKVFKTPMPHTQYSDAGGVVADYVRVETAPKAANTAMFAQQPRQTLAACIAEHQQRGQPVNPPKTYPSFDLPAHRDTYIAANRTITYTHSYGYQVRMEDCSLSETETHRAVLKSAVGTCTFDLVARTSEGSCDLDAHRKAAPLPRKPADANIAAMRKRMAEMESDPRRAAAMAQVRQLAGTMPAMSGQKKTILGIECEVVRDAGGRSACTSQSGLLLEGETPGLGTSKAVDAMLDAKVSEAVFAPLAAAKGGAK